MKKRQSLRRFVQKTCSEKNSRIAVQHEKSAIQKAQYENSETRKRAT